MLIFCPECQRQLRVPDEAAGKRVQCPSCQKVFAAGSATTGEEIQAPPAPRPTASAPPPETFDEELPRRSSREDVDAADIDLRDNDTAQRRASACGLWLHATAIVAIVTAAVNLTLALALGAIEGGPFDLGDPDELLVGILCMGGGCGSIFLTLNVLLIAAGTQLRSFGNKGWVVAGIVAAFVQALLLGLVAFVYMIWMFDDVHDALDHWAPLTMIFSGCVAILNCFVAVKTIITISNPLVSAEFEQHRSQRHRRLRWDD